MQKKERIVVKVGTSTLTHENGNSKLRAYEDLALALSDMQNNGNAMRLAVYPEVHRYTEWYPFNGRLVLHADTIAGFTKEGEKPITDTAEIVLLRRDSLILRVGGAEQSFYRKRESEQ